MENSSQINHVFFGLVHPNERNKIIVNINIFGSAIYYARLFGSLYIAAGCRSA